MYAREFLMEVNEDPRVLTGEEVQRCLEGAGVFWLYSGDPRSDNPHARFTSGKHSNGFVDVGRVLRDYSGVRGAFAKSLVAILGEINLNSLPDFVVGADTSSTALARDMAEIMMVRHIVMAK